MVWGSGRSYLVSYFRSAGAASYTFLFLCLFYPTKSLASGDTLAADSSIAISKSHSRPDSALSTPVYTQPQRNRSNTAGIATLEKMVVTASWRQRLLESSQSLAIIKPDEWVGTNKSIADVVAEQTGVQTRRYGGTGSFQTVSIRGVQGNEVLVLLDGIPLNSAMGGAVDLGAISTDRIGEIEVYKGITPGEYGGNALGGLINLKSKTAMKAQSISAQTAFGAYGYQKYGIETNNIFSGRYRVFGSLDYVKSENNWPYLDRNKTPYNAADDAVKKVENNQYDLIEARIHPTFDLPCGAC